VDAVNGNLAAVPGGVTTDLDGNLRIAEGDGDGKTVVDMGACETRYSDLYLLLVLCNS